MIKAVLFDLDNTLLKNPPSRFVRGYVQALTAYLHERFPHVDAARIQEGLRTAIRCTIGNLDPLHSNWQIFANHFSEATGLTADQIRDPLTQFYAEIYPSLQPLTEPVASSSQLVQWLLDHHYGVGVATNPLFETDPVEQRLGWANLGPQIANFAFVTSLNNTHFTKPNPHYYEEILSRIGVEPEETLMVGDDWYNDMLPAMQAGLNTFWLPTEEEHTLPQATPDVHPDGSGTMADLARLIMHEDWLNHLMPHALTVEQIEPRMLGNLAGLMGLVDSIEPHHWHQHPDPNEWSPIEIITHLRDSEHEIQRPRLERILQEVNPFLSAPLPPPAPNQMPLTSDDGRQVALDFANERRKTLDLLATLAPAQWQRAARHSVLGPTTLLEMAAFTTRHDHLHITQLCQTLGRCE